MNELIPSFPRQCAFPERINCITKDKFYRYINSYNGIKPKIYFSLYKINEVGHFLDNDFITDIDKISFDLDNKNCVSVAKKIHNYCMNNNLRHCIIFSTGGIWIHIKTKNYKKLKYPKSTLTNSQKHIINKLNLKCGKNPKYDDIDFHIIGDIARVARMPGTLDIARGLYAQSIKAEDLTNIEHIKKIAKKNNSRIYWYGKEKINLKEYDHLTEEEKIEMREYEYTIEVDNNVLKKFPPCIQECILRKPLKGYNQHWVWVTIYLKEIGFTKVAIEKLLKPFLEKIERNDGKGSNEWEHYRKYDHLPESVFTNGYFFPKCEILWQKGFCVGKCKKFNKLYK